MAILVKYIAVINLLLLAGFTYILADLFSLFIGQRFEVSPSLPSVETLTAGPGEARPSREVYRTIIDRNIFNTQPVGAISDPSIEQFESALPAELPPLALKLVGTVAGGPQHSFAFIQDLGTKEEHLYRLGDPVGGDGKVVEIRRNEVVVLRAGGIRETIEVEWNPGSSKKSSRPSPKKASLPEPPAVAPGQTSFTLERQEVEETLQNLPQLLTKARVVPHLNREGKSEGFRIISIKPDSFYQKIGLKNGDIIQQINGIEIKDPTTFMSVFSQLRNESNITLDLVRRNQKETFTYDIR
jgi:general secretion pathway protein C